MTRIMCCRNILVLIPLKVQDVIEDILVAPGDVIGIQHDAGPSGVLACTSDSQSPWKQSILIQNRSNWAGSNETLDVADDWHRAENLVCSIRVLYVGMNQTRLRGPILRAGLPHPGNYSLEVASVHLEFPVSASCPIHIIPPLQPALIYPAYQNGTVYFLPNQTSVLVKVHSEYNVVLNTLSSEGEHTVPFRNSCPPELVTKVPDCQTPNQVDDHTLFAWLDLRLGVAPGNVKVVLHASSEVTEAQLEMRATVEELIQGLEIHPNPAHRVLMETVVVRLASPLYIIKDNKYWCVPSLRVIFSFAELLGVCERRH